MHRGYIDEREARRVQKENVRRLACTYCVCLSMYVCLIRLMQDTGKKTKRDVVRTENVATAIASIVGASTGAMGQQSKRARTDSGPDAAAAQQQSSVAFIKKSKKINFNALQVTGAFMHQSLHLVIRSIYGRVLWISTMESLSSRG